MKSQLWEPDPHFQIRGAADKACIAKDAQPKVKITAGFVEWLLMNKVRERQK